MRQRLWFLAAAGILLAFTANVSYYLGHREFRDFQAMCAEPGVRCVVEFSPAYLMTHRGIEIPRSIVGEFAEDDGRMQ